MAVLKLYSCHEAVGRNMSYGVHPDCRIYWANPLSYITRAILINEFTASKHITSQHCVAAQCSTATKSPNFLSDLLLRTQFSKLPQLAIIAWHRMPDVQRLCECNDDAVCHCRPCCNSCMHIHAPTHHYSCTVSGVAADHWQNKLYPYGSTQTLGDGILGSIGISTHYYWCWIAIGVCLAYILLFNVIIVILLTVLPRKFVFPSTLSVVVQRVLIWYSAWCCLFSGAGVWHPICATNAVTLCTSCLVFPELSSAAAHIPCNVLLNIGPSCFL